MPEESSKRSVQQLKNSVGRAQFWCEEPACRGVQQNGGVPDQRCQKQTCLKYAESKIQILDSPSLQKIVACQSN